MYQIYTQYVHLHLHSARIKSFKCWKNVMLNSYEWPQHTWMLVYCSIEFWPPSRLREQKHWNTTQVVVNAKVYTKIMGWQTGGNNPQKPFCALYDENWYYAYELCRRRAILNGINFYTIDRYRVYIQLFKFSETY